MQPHFGIIAGLCLALAACGNGNPDSLDLTRSSTALGCGGNGVPCAPPSGTVSSPPSRHGGSADAGSSAHALANDAGQSGCDSDADCPYGQRCERHYAESQCHADHDNRGPGNGHDGEDDSYDDRQYPPQDAGTTPTPACADDRDCDHDDCSHAEYDDDRCDEDGDRSGSNSGRH
jgi:hypothetical protein